MANKTDYARKCQQLDVVIDLLERENKRLQAEKREWKPLPAPYKKNEVAT